MMPCSRTVPRLRPVMTRQTAARVAVQTVRRCGGGNVIPKTIGTALRSLPSMGALFRTQDMPELRAHFGS